MTQRKSRLLAAGIVILGLMTVIAWLYATGGAPERAKNVTSLPLILAPLSIIGFIVAALRARWQGAFLFGAGLIAATVSWFLVLATSCVIAPILADRARETVEKRIAASLIDRGPEHLVLGDFPDVYGWGWYAHAFRNEDGGMVCLRDYFRESGWDYHVQTASWERREGLPLVHALLEPIEIRGVSIGLFLAAVAGAVVADRKVAQSRNDVRRQVD